MNAFQRWIAPLLVTLLTAVSVWAQTSPYSATPIQAIPPNITGRDFPAMMMLAASRDHTLFGPMFTDYEDLTGSGRIDPTFVPTFSYYGYFDPTKCYAYESESGTFVPKAFAVERACNFADSAGRWSGNFLNWATMTRIDVVRKMLYGGYRYIDTPTETVLQLALLGNDAHAFAKYYRGADIAKYTPFSTSDLTVSGTYVGLTTCTLSESTDATRGVPVIVMAKGNYLLWSTTAGKVCRWRPNKDVRDPGNINFLFGQKLVEYFKRDAAISGSDLEGMPAHGLVAPFGDADDLPPSIPKAGLNVRVKACVSASLIGQENCKRFEYVEGGVRKTALKPSGILIDYGYSASSEASARAEFGLISGSFERNLSGGVLRKNMGNLNDEIRSDGTFCHNTGTCPDAGSIIKSMDAIRLYAVESRYTTLPSFQWRQPWRLNNGEFPSWGNPVGEMLLEALSYYSNKGPSTYKSTATSIDSSLGLPTPAWQDPLSDSIAVAGAEGKNRGQLYGKSVCRSMNALAISSSAVSFDRDELGAFDRLPNRAEGSGLAKFTNDVGARENINGSKRSVADAAGVKADGTGGWNGDCKGKDVTFLWDVSGICPEAPATRGSYISAGAALYANTHAIRSIGSGTSEIPGYRNASDLPADLPGNALRVKTLAAAMGGGVARIEVLLPNPDASKGPLKAYITPTSFWDLTGKVPESEKTDSPWMAGALLTIKLLNSKTVDGRTVAASYVVTWNDSQFGGDYDMDIVGYISYSIEDGELKITTDILDVDAGMAGSHGFTITGAVDGAGTYLTHGSNGFKYGECADLWSAGKTADFNRRCRFRNDGMPRARDLASYDGWQWPTAYDGTTIGFGAGEQPSSITKSFTINTAQSGSVLQDPLWYAAKYGSFDTAETSFSTVYKGELPKATDSTDGYFLARDPAKLEMGLRRALDKILSAGNSTPAVSTAQLISTSLKYVAEFDAKAMTGEVKAYELDAETKLFKTTPKFALGAKLTEASMLSEGATGARQIMTNVGLLGVPFKVASFEADTPTNATVKTNLNADAGTDSWKELVPYVRGGVATGDLRPRLSNVLGPIVNAAPWLQRGAMLRMTDVELPAGWASYRSFVKTRLDNAYPSVLWVASNDSMLHAFNADTGEALFSYLPSPLMAGLRAASRDSTKTITATMDGSPYTADVYLPSSPSGNWRTYLFSSLGRGGRAVFALDVTNPADLTERNAGNVFKWMFSSEDSADMGHVLTDPVVHRTSGQPTPVVRLNNGKFALMVPNGYGSANGRAVLFLVDVQGRYPDGTWGDRVKSLVTADTDSGNGLMGATWVDIDNNGTADWIYATDLKGQVWKFDVSSSDPAEWKSAFEEGAGVAKPLFQAKSGAFGDGAVLPITTPPTVSLPAMGGVLVSFGTGKSIVDGDFPKTTLTQRFYTLWDRGTFTTESVVGSVTTKRALPTHATLASRQAVRNAESGIVSLAGEAKDWTIDWTNKDGWYLDFPVTAGQTAGSGDMVLSAPVVRSGILFFTTVWPNGSDSMCQTSPFATLYAVNPVSGTAVNGLVFGLPIKESKFIVVQDRTGDSKVNTEDLKVITRDKEESLTVPASSGRIQWRVIPGLKTH